MNKAISALWLELGIFFLSPWKRNKIVLPSGRHTCPFPFLAHMLTMLRYHLDIAIYAWKSFQLRCVEILLHLPEQIQLCRGTSLPQSLYPVIDSEEGKSRRAMKFYIGRVWWLWQSGIWSVHLELSHQSSKTLNYTLSESRNIVALTVYILKIYLPPECFIVLRLYIPIPLKHRIIANLICVLVCCGQMQFFFWLHSNEMGQKLALLRDCNTLNILYHGVGLMSIEALLLKRGWWPAPSKNREQLPAQNTTFFLLALHSVCRRNLLPGPLYLLAWNYRMNL